VGGVDRPRRARVAAETKLLVGFEYRQTNVKYLGKIANIIVTR